MQQPADEVTPPLTPGDDWTQKRVAWQEDFHRRRRDGLDGPARKATWAVATGARVVGSVRLKALSKPHSLETGIWLARQERGKGVGRQAVAAVLKRAAAAGALKVLAETTPGNQAAQGLLRSLGFGLVASDDVGVRGRFKLGEPCTMSSDPYQSPNEIAMGRPVTGDGGWRGSALTVIPEIGKGTLGHGLLGRRVHVTLGPVDRGL